MDKKYFTNIGSLINELENNIGNHKKILTQKTNSIRPLFYEGQWVKICSLKSLIIIKKIIDPSWELLDCEKDHGIYIGSMFITKNMIPLLNSFQKIKHYGDQGLYPYATFDNIPFVWFLWMLEPCRYNEQKYFGGYNVI